jgi:hypothetical protein
VVAVCVEWFDLAYVQNQASALEYFPRTEPGIKVGGAWQVPPLVRLRFWIPHLCRVGEFLHGATTVTPKERGINRRDETLLVSRVVRKVHLVLCDLRLINDSIDFVGTKTEFANVISGPPICVTGITDGAYLALRIGARTESNRWRPPEHVVCRALEHRHGDILNAPGG